METYIDFFIKNRVGGIRSHIHNRYVTINDVSSVDEKIFQPHQEGAKFHKLMIFDIRKDDGKTLSLEFNDDGKIKAWIL